MHRAAVVMLGGLLGLAGASPAAAAERPIAVSAVRAVSAVNGVRVELTQGPAKVVVSGPENLLDRLEVTEQNGLVRVQPRRSLGLFGSAPEQVVVHVSAPMLERVSAQNGAALKGWGLSVGTFRAEVENGAVITLEGVCVDGAFAAARGGVLQVEGLPCEAVSAEASLGGVARVGARTAVSAKASFGGVVEVVGAPTERVVESSMGGLVRFQDARDED